MEGFRGFRALILLTSVLCDVVVGRLQITYCFIVRWLVDCGILFSNLQGFCGSYLVQFQICSLVGEIGWGSIPQKSGTQYHCAYCGVLGESVISRPLRTYTVLEISCFVLLVDLCLTSLRFGDSLLVILFHFS